MLQKLVKVEVPQRIKERSSKKSMAIDNLIARIEQEMEKMNTTLIIYRLKFEAPMRYQLELGVFKKTDQPIKPKDKEKINRKNETDKKTK